MSASSEVVDIAKAEDNEGQDSVGPLTVKKSDGKVERQFEKKVEGKIGVSSSWTTHNQGLQIGHNSGSILISTHPSRAATFTSLFGNLDFQEFNDAMRERVNKRRRFQDSRILKQNITYTPYVEVNVQNSKVLRHLLQIARRLQFIDRGFAEYFQRVLPSYGEDHIRQRLADARKGITTSHRQGVATLDSSDSIFLGDLGHFCEEVARQWTEAGPEPKFTTTHGRAKEVLHYLRDALEVPYWEFMLDIFSGWRANSRTLSGEVVLRVLNSVKLDVLAKRRLLDEVKFLEKDEDGIALILKGIDARLDVLKSLWDDATSDTEMDDMLESIFEEKLGVPAGGLTSQDSAPGNPQHETVMLVALSLVFLTAAIVPGYKGFAISMQENSIGSTGDADFWYLIQSNIMAVLGNLAMVIPLMRKSWFSPAYSWMWVFFAAGLAFSVVSVVIYPLCNTGWSSVVAFFGSIASASSVLVMTQATAMTSDKKKEKQKTE